MGLHKAGFEVVGFDIEEQLNYPFEFYQEDALDVDLSGFDAVWASPPCQGYMGAATGKAAQTPRLIGKTRTRIQTSGLPYIIENVMGAEIFLENPIMLCGSMFESPVQRHRMFEASFRVLNKSHIRCRKFKDGIKSDPYYQSFLAKDPRIFTVSGHGRGVATFELWKEWMHMPWVEVYQELTEAIPPYYSEFLGLQMIRECFHA